MTRRSDYIEIEEDILRELYETELLSVEEIASAMGVSHGTIWNRMNEFGISRRKQQTRKEFSLENFNDGYVDNKGRFRVWYPAHPNAYHEGYMLRAIIAFEFYHGISVPNGMDIHHKDGNRLNDSKENLEMLSHGEHSSLSNPLKEVERTCLYCGRKFTIKEWRLRDARRGKFCSQEHYHLSRK